MRIALLSANPPTANPYIGLLRDGLAAAGADAQLFLHPGPNGLPAAARAADVLHLHWLELWGRPAYLNLAELGRLGKPGRGLRRLLVPRFNSQAVFAWRRRRFLNRFLDSLATYRTAGGQLVYTVHNLAPHEGEASAVEIGGLRRLLTLTDAVHVHGDHVAGELRAIAPDAPAPVTIPHGNYIGAYPNEIDRSAARRRLDLPAASPVFLFLGLIRPYKGLQELLAAFGRLENPEARLLIAGQSRPPGYAAGLLATSDDHRVRWHPHFVPDDEIQVWMNAADAVVLPYRRITTSGAALLAFSFGKPVIAPRLPAFTELMGANPALGLLYDPSAADGLREALRQAASIEWQSRQPTILNWVCQFDWEHIGRQLLALYESLAENQ